MLMARLWWVQADVTMKRWRDINDSLRWNTGRIKSHISRHGVLARENVYSSAARLSWTEERCTLTEFITSAMLYAQPCWPWMFLWCWRVAAPCCRCQLTGHQKRPPPSPYKLVRQGYFNMLRDYVPSLWSHKSRVLSLHVKASSRRCTSACFCSEEENVLKPHGNIWQIQSQFDILGSVCVCGG